MVVGRVGAEEKRGAGSPTAADREVMERLGLILSGWGRDAAQTAERCTECGEWEKRCPCKLPVRQGIREGAARFRALASGARP